jgi:xylulokinase
VSQLFCGIDIGTTNLKVLLLDENGTTLWVKSVPAPHLRDELGVVTDARALVSMAEALIIEGWKAVAQGRKLAAIATAGIGEDGVGVRDDLSPLGHAIQWNDRRGEPYAHQLAASELGKAYPAILLDFSSSAGKWAWLRQHKPEELQGAVHWLTMTDYPLAVWAGRAFMSATLAPRTGCYDVFSRAWIPGFLTHVNAPPLPPLLEAGAVVGSMRDGPLMAAGAADANTMLVAGGHDHPVAASAIRRILKDARIDSMGTANATYGETETLQPDDTLNGLYVTLPISGAKAAAVIGMTEFSLTLAKQFGDAAAVYQTLLSMRHVADIPAPLKATLVELAMTTKRFWAAMTCVGVPQAPVLATGGWSKSPAVVQLRASVFGETVTVVDEPELVALGAALFAAQGVGATPIFSAAKHSHVVDPLHSL